MNVLTSVLESLRGKRQADFRTHAEQYNEIITHLAKGEQCDIDKIAIVLDALDKSDSELKMEVEAKQRRLAAADNLTRLRNVAASIPALADELRQLDEELTNIINQKKPAIEAAAERLREAESKVPLIVSEETTLRTVGIPVELAARQQQLQAMIQELKPKRERYESYTASERKRLPIAQRNLDEALRYLDSCGPHEPGNLRNAQSKVDLLSQDVKQLELRLSTFEPLRHEIETLQAAIDAERKAIDAELLIP